MTAISLINPYAPQPAQASLPDAGVPAAQITTPAQDTATNNMSGGASDQSGAGAGNGTGTGGAQLAALLQRGREEIETQKPTPKSVVEAQTTSQAADAFLTRQARLQAEVKAAEDRIAAQKADEPAYEMPNPLPTAPILKRDDG